MASQSLDQLVKGAPAPDPSLASSSSSASDPTHLPRAYLQVSPDPSSSQHRPPTPDPLLTLPSSPPQIYLNLLILEASLRAQYLALRERRRQNTFFLLLLAAWIAYFSYALFLRPREDGSGVGGSIYWMVEMGEKVALMGGAVTALLVWGTGQWERGIRWPRRWLAVANRGLRSMNTKIVVIRGSWWQELLSYLSFIFPFFHSPAENFHYVERSLVEKRGGRHHHSHHQYYDADSETGLVEEDLSPGGDYIRLLLLPKSFSPEFRENWDEYRTDFWEKENERRAQLRQKLREREHQLAQQEGGWLWWLGLGWKTSRRRRLAAAAALNEKPHHPHRHRRHSSISKLGHELKPSSSSRRSIRSDSHSRTSSRSSTPADGSWGGGDERPPSRGGRPRRGSSTLSSSISSTTEQGQQPRRKRSNKGLSRGLSPLTQAQIREGLHPPDDPFSIGFGETENNEEKDTA